MNDLSFRRRILCVDDDTESRAVLEGILAENTLVFAPTAFDAVRLTNAGGFHGYVLDYWLPDWSGASLCRAIRKVDPNAPIVFCSAAVRELDRAKALRAGANAYLCKPLDPEELRAKLGAFLSLAEMESLRAKVEEERAIQLELERRVSGAISRTNGARDLAATSIERTARAKAYKAFIEAHGCRAHFESWWPQVFGSARANLDIR